MRRAFTKLAALMGLLGSLGMSSTTDYKKAQQAKKIDERKSLSMYAENNFNSLSFKRVNGKWRVKR